MHLAIMQPYFFPYLGYFSLIEATDHFVVFDTAQYIRKGWVNRNRILKKGEDWKYIGINIIKMPRETPICEITCHPEYNICDKILRNLDYYYLKKAPYYHEVYSLIKRALDIQENRLTALLTNSLKETCSYIGIKFDYSIFSQSNIKIASVAHPGEWAFRISKSMGAKTYINPPGGKNLFSREQFESSGIRLKFIEPFLPPYYQGGNIYIEGLSIIDVLMWNSPEDTRKMIKQYRIDE